MDQFLSAHHVVVRPEGRTHQVDKFLERQGISRTIQLEISHFMSLLPIVASSQLIATIPNQFAEICVQYGGVKVFPVPVSTPSIDVSQFWHRRLHNDAGHKWLREKIHQLFT